MTKVIYIYLHIVILLRIFYLVIQEHITNVLMLSICKYESTIFKTICVISKLTCYKTLNHFIMSSGIDSIYNILTE